MLAISKKLKYFYEKLLITLSSSAFIKNVFWNASITVFERVAAVAQTILIARGLGITEYGVYGLWFGTVGFIGSILGLQMGLTATVFLARYKTDKKEKAAAVIRHVYRYALFVGALVIIVCAPFLSHISIWLFHSPGYTNGILIGLIFVGFTIFSGVQDGILQGFEDFKSVSFARALAVLLTLSLSYPAAKYYGLTGVLFLLLAILIIKTLVMAWIVLLRKNHLKIPNVPDRETHLGDIALKFSIPSMMTSLLVGLAAWIGSIMLSRQDNGFDKLAIVNAGLQWRGAILTLAASVGSVAIPVFSRYMHLERNDSAKVLKSRLLRFNLVGAFIATALLIAVSPLLLALYGQEFTLEPLLFCLLILSTIPQVVANVYLQNLVGQGQMLKQLAIHLPVYGISILLYFLLVPIYSGYGYAWATLITAIMLYLALLINEWHVNKKGLR